VFGHSDSEYDRSFAVSRLEQHNFTMEWSVALLKRYGGACFHISFCEESIANQESGRTQSLTAKRYQADESILEELHFEVGC
jgi:hypothetical protein